MKMRHFATLSCIQTFPFLQISLTFSAGNHRAFRCVLTLAIAINSAPISASLLGFNAVDPGAWKIEKQTLHTMHCVLWLHKILIIPSSSHIIF